MVRAKLLESNQNENKWCCAAETLEEVHIFKTHSTLGHTSPHLHGMIKIPASVNSEYLYMIYTPSHHILKFR